MDTPICWAFFVFGPLVAVRRTGRLPVFGKGGSGWQAGAVSWKYPN
ncbi:MAG: hypothetical protein MUC60_01210 [Oscillatoria sp. Prado101]|nr:hypothetical protein [Oscillatoria sp. Prado101]